MSKLISPVVVSAAIAAALAGYAYLPTLHHPFVYDDLVTIVGNPSLREPSSLSALVLHARFRPVVNASYAGDYALWRLRPFGYHLTSVLLHMANVFLLSVLAARLVADGARRDRERAHRWSPAVAGFTAGSLLAVHPLMTEAVAYVSGRSEVLCATFFLAAFLTLRAGVVRGSAAWTLVGAGAAVLALASKEIAAALPIVLLAWDRLLAGDSTERARRRLFTLHAPLMGAVTVLGVVRLATYVHVESRAPVSLLHHVAVQPLVLWRYLGLLGVPVGQSLVHEVEPAPLALGVAMPALAALGVVLWRLRPRAPLAVLGAVWFFAVLAPSSLVPLGEAMAEHRVYLAGAGVFVVAGMVAARVAARAADASRAWRLAASATLAVVLAVLLGLTVVRSAVWADPVALWTDATRKTPGAWRAHFSLGNALAESGRCAEAIGEYREAIRLAPQGQMYLNLATCLAAERRVDEARRAYEQALVVEPGYVAAHYNLALLALARGDPDLAHRHLLQAVTAAPTDDAWRRLLFTTHAARIDDRRLRLELCRRIARVAPATPGVDDCLAAGVRR